LFGADKSAAGASLLPHAPPPESDALPGAIAARRAAEFLFWLIALVVLAALIGFIPAIGVFTFLYMGFGFHEKLYRSAIFGVAMGVFCWALFDRGLAVPWPQAVLGDLFP